MLNATVNLYRNAYTGLTRRVWLLAIVMLINRSGTMVLAFMTLYVNHIGYSTKQAGLVVGVYGIGSLVGAFIGGKISDRFGFYYTQFFSLFCGGLLFITLGQMNTYLSICICTFFNFPFYNTFWTFENQDDWVRLINLNLNFTCGEVTIFYQMNFSISGNFRRFQKII